MPVLYLSVGSVGVGVSLVADMYYFKGLARLLIPYHLLTISIMNVVCDIYFDGLAYKFVVESSDIFEIFFERLYIS